MSWKSLITWAIFFAIVFWQLTNFAEAQFQAIYAIQDARNSKIMEIMGGK